jgi:hypothetical protein
MSSTFVDGVTPLDATHLNALQQKIEKAAANGYASLDSGGKVPLAQLPPGSNGQWLKTSGGAAVWAAITPADVGTAKITTSGIAGGPPASPSNGDIWIAAGVYLGQNPWAFCYNAGSGSPYKWEFIGGGPVVVRIDTSEATSSGAIVDLATPGPSFTVPRAGDYHVGVTVGVTQGSAVSFSAGAFVTPANVVSAQTMVNGAGSGWQASAHGEGVMLAVAAATLLKVQYNTGAGQVSFFNRTLTVLPRNVA